MVTSIAIYGAGGLGREILTLIRTHSEWNVIGFFDDGVKKGSIVDGVEVLGGRADILQYDTLQLVVAVADPVSKRKIVESLESFSGVQFPTVIHPSAILQDTNRIEIGKGTVITAGCILTTGIVIGNHVLLNLNCTVGHDVVIEEFSSIMPGVNLAGKVHIGKSVLVGSGAQIINQSKIGELAKVGSGAVVTRNVDAHSTVVGVPANPLKK